MSEFEISQATASQVLKMLRERALMRLLGASSFDWRDYLTDEEIAQYDNAMELEGAQPEEVADTGETLVKLGKVLIEVYGGVAAVTSNPSGVEVEIVDHDNVEG